MDKAPDPKTRGLSRDACARGELNRRSTTLDRASTPVLSVKRLSRCLRLTPVPSGLCTPGVHQPYSVEPSAMTVRQPSHRPRDRIADANPKRPPTSSRPGPRAFEHAQACGLATDGEPRENAEVKVQVLHVEACPNPHVSGQRARSALDAVGLGKVPVEYVLVGALENAGSAEFAESPTILIDGEDAFPGGASGEGLAACRLYPTEDGLGRLSHPDGARGQRSASACRDRCCRSALFFRAML